MLDTFQVNDGRWRLLYVFLLKMFGGSDLTDAEMSPGHHKCRYGPCVLLHRDQCRYCLRYGHYGNECWTRRFDSGETAEEIANYQSNKKAKKASWHQSKDHQDTTLYLHVDDISNLTTGKTNGQLTARAARWAFDFSWWTKHLRYITLPTFCVEFVCL